MPLIIKESYSLKDLNTFGIDAKARFFVEVDSDVEGMEALGYAKTNNLRVFILGGGSNILVSDSGFNGLVVHNKIKGLQIEDGGLVKVGGGESWDELVAQTVKAGLAGIECLSGVPGSAGGAVVQNIGAYGQTLSDVLVYVNTIEASTGMEKVFKAEECKLEYRSSIFKKNPGKYFVTGFEINLKQNGAPTVNYPDVIKYLGENPPTLAQIRKAVLEIRASKGMVIMPEYESYRSVGSFFVNPIVSKEDFEKLEKLIQVSESRPWFWPVSGDKVKVSAAKLITLAGFEKGYKEGNVSISPKQPLAIINLGEAKASEIKSFALKIKQAVLEKFGVKLEEEVLFVGNFD